MRRLALAALLALAAAPALPAAAHQRSQSFSTWRVEGEEVRGVWSVLALEATRLTAETGSLDDLARFLAAHLDATLALRRGGAPCVARPARPLRARPGHLRIELAFHCPEPGSLELASSAFVDAAPSHVHFARVVAAGEPPRERIFTAAERTQILAGEPAAEGPASAGFLRCFDALSAAYLEGVAFEGVEARTASLLPALLLARVDGKSPVEYLTAESQKSAVRRFAGSFMEKPVSSLSEVRKAWQESLT